MNIELLSGKIFNSVKWVRLPVIEGKINFARINRLTGDLELDPVNWPKLPAHFRRFYELHEFAHWKYNNPSEEFANNWAIKNFIRFPHLIQDNKDLAEIKEFIRVNNLNDISLNSTNEYSYNPLAVAIISAGAGLVSLFGGNAAKKKERDLIKAQNELAAKTESERLQAQLKILELQAELQDDEQEANERQTIIIGAGIGAFILLVFAILIIKQLAK